MKPWPFALAAVLSLVLAPAFSQSLESMTGPQLVVQLKALAAEFRETEAVLDENAAVAEQNRALLATLNAESGRLSADTGEYDRDVAAHNRAVGDYGERCLGKKLPEAEYTPCWAEKERLQEQKRVLDQRAEELQARHSEYNRKVASFNQREAARAEAASRLLQTFRKTDAKIRSIQLRLYELAVGRPEDGFGEENRRCTKLTALDQMVSCFERAWSNVSG